MAITLDEMRRVNQENMRDDMRRAAAAAGTQRQTTGTLQAPSTTAYAPGGSNNVVTQPAQTADTRTLWERSPAEIEADIFRNYGEDKPKMASAYAELDALYKTPGNPLYNPYRESTNQSLVKDLQGYGIDVSGGINDEFFAQNAAYQQYLLPSDLTGTPSKPNAKTGTRNQWIAYDLYQLAKDEETTKKAESEWSQLQKDLTYWVNKGLTDDEALAKVDMSSYPTLKKMDEARGLGTYTPLNRAVGYSQDAMKGVMWAARNGDMATDDMFRNGVYACLGYGNQGTASDYTISQRNPGSANYNPYIAGATDDAARQLFGVDSFDQAWINDHMEALSDPDSAETKAYRRIMANEETTQAAEEELARLKRALQGRDLVLNEGETLYEGCERAVRETMEALGLSTLQKMDEARRQGQYVSLNRSVDYRLEDVANNLCQHAYTPQQLERGAGEGASFDYRLFYGRARQGQVYGQSPYRQLPMIPQLEEAAQEKLRQREELLKNAARRSIGNSELGESGTEGQKAPGSIQTHYPVDEQGNVVRRPAPTWATEAQEQPQEEQGTQEELQPSAGISPSQGMTPTATPAPATAAPTGANTPSGASSFSSPLATPEATEESADKTEDEAQTDTDNSEFRIPNSELPQGPSLAMPTQEEYNRLLDWMQNEFSERMSGAGRGSVGMLAAGGLSDGGLAPSTAMKESHEFDSLSDEDLRGRMNDESLDAVTRLQAEMELGRREGEITQENAATWLALRVGAAQQIEGLTFDEVTQALTKMYRGDDADSLTDREKAILEQVYSPVAPILRFAYDQGAADGYIRTTFGEDVQRYMLALASGDATVEDLVKGHMELYGAAQLSWLSYGQFDWQDMEDVEYLEHNRLSEFYANYPTEALELQDITRAIEKRTEERQAQEAAAAAQAESEKQDLLYDTTMALAEDGTNQVSQADAEAYYHQLAAVGTNGQVLNQLYQDSYYLDEVDDTLKDYLTQLESTQGEYSAAYVNGTLEGPVMDSAARNEIHNLVEAHYRDDMRLAMAMGLDLEGLYEKFPAMKYDAETVCRLAAKEYSDRFTLTEENQAANQETEENIQSLYSEYGGGLGGWAQAAWTVVSKGVESGWADFRGSNVGFLADLRQGTEADYRNRMASTYQGQYGPLARQQYRRDLMAYAGKLSDEDPRKAVITAGLQDSLVNGTDIFALGFDLSYEQLEDARNEVLKPKVANDQFMADHASDAERTAYGVFESATNSLVGMAEAAVVTAITGNSMLGTAIGFAPMSFDGAYRTAIEHGMDYGQAKWYAAISAAIEVITENEMLQKYYNPFLEGLENFGAAGAQAMASNGYKGARAFLNGLVGGAKVILANQATEIGQEYFQEVCDAIWEGVNMKDPELFMQHFSAENLKQIAFSTALSVGISTPVSLGAAGIGRRVAAARVNANANTLIDAAASQRMAQLNAVENESQLTGDLKADFEQFAEDQTAARNQQKAEGIAQAGENAVAADYAEQQAAAAAQESGQAAQEATQDQQEAVQGEIEQKAAQAQTEEAFEREAFSGYIDQAKQRAQQELDRARKAVEKAKAKGDTTAEERAQARVDKAENRLENLDALQAPGELNYGDRRAWQQYLAARQGEFGIQNSEFGMDSNSVAEESQARAEARNQERTEALEGENAVTPGAFDGLNGYSKHDIDNWSNNSKIQVCQNAEQLNGFISKSISDKLFAGIMHLGKIGKTIAQRISTVTGIDVEGYNLAIDADEVRKIKKSHGSERTEALRGQRAVTETDIARIPEVIAQPDTVELSDKTYNGNETLVFKKDMPDHTTVVAYIRKKKHNLQVQTMYISAAKENSGQLAVTNSATGQDQASLIRPERVYGTSSTDTTVAQTATDVNRSDEAAAPVDMSREELFRAWKKARLAEMQELRQRTREANAMKNGATVEEAQAQTEGESEFGIQNSEFGMESDSVAEADNQAVENAANAEENSENADVVTQAEEAAEEANESAEVVAEEAAEETSESAEEANESAEETSGVVQNELTEEEKSSLAQRIARNIRNLVVGIAQRQATDTEGQKRRTQQVAAEIVADTVATTWEDGHPNTPEMADLSAKAKQAASLAQQAADEAAAIAQQAASQRDAFLNTVNQLKENPADTRVQAASQQAHETVNSLMSELENAQDKAETAQAEAEAAQQTYEHAVQLSFDDLRLEAEATARQVVENEVRQAQELVDAAEYEDAAEEVLEPEKSLPILGRDGQELTWTAEELAANRQKVAQSEAVAVPSGEKYLGIAKNKDLIDAAKQDIGQKNVENPLLGEVEISKKGLRHFVSQNATQVRRSLIAAIPEVIRNGEVISFDNNHKGKDFGTVLLAERVTTPDGQNYVMGVVVKQDANQHNGYYMHEGYVVKENTTAGDTRVSAPITADDINTGSGTIWSILSQIAAVNPQNGTNETQTNTVADVNNLANQESAPNQQTQDSDIQAAKGDPSATQQNQPNQQTEAEKNRQKGELSVPYVTMKKLAERLGTGLYAPTKDAAKKKAAGYYKPSADYVAVGKGWTNNYGTLTHEVGHALQQKTGITTPDSLVKWLQTTNPEFAAQYNASELSGEAFAEFTRLYMTSPETAAAVAGDFLTEYEQGLRAAGLYDAVMEAREDFTLWHNATAGDRASALVVDYAGQNSKKATGDVARQAARRVLGGMVDDTTGARAIDRAAGTIQADDSIKAALDLAKFAQRKALYQITGGLTTMSGERVDVGLTEALGLKTNQEYDDLTKYKLYQQALDRQAQAQREADQAAKLAEAKAKVEAAAKNGEVLTQEAAMEQVNQEWDKAAKNGTPKHGTVPHGYLSVFGDNLTMEQIEHELEEMRKNQPKIAEASDRFDSWWKEFMQIWAPEAGISQETLDDFSDKYPHWFPTQRDLSDGLFHGLSGATNLQNQAGTLTFHTAKGSDLTIVNPMGIAQMTIGEVVEAAHQNRANGLLYEHIQQEGMGAFAREVSADLKDEGDVVVYADKNGNKHYMQVPDIELYRAMTANGRHETLAGALKAVGKLTRGMSALTTGMNPLFAAKNFMRDFQSSVNRGSWAVTYVDGLVNWARAFYEVSFNEKGWKRNETVEQYKALGGGGFTYMNPITNQRTATEARQNIIGKKAVPTVAQVFGNLKDFVTFSHLNEYVETTSRYAEYRFGQHDLSTEAGRYQAFLEAQEATVNFNRSGDSALARELRATVPFWNATLQGTYQLATVFDQYNRGRALQFVGKTLLNNMLLGAMSALLVKKFGSDEDKEQYDKLSPAVLMDNVIIPRIGGGDDHPRQFIRLPLGQNLWGKAFYALGNQLALAANGDALTLDVATAAEHLLGDVIKSDTIFDPALSLMSNQNYYGGTLVSTRLQGLPETQQANETTPELFKAFSRVLSTVGINVTPIGAQYVAQQMSGYIGQLLIPMLSPDSLTGEMDPLGNAYRVLRNSFTIDPAYNNDISDNYYKGLNMLTAIVDGAKQQGYSDVLSVSLSPEEAQAYVNEAAALQSKGGKLYAISQEIDSLRDMMAQMIRQGRDQGWGHDRIETERKHIQQEIVRKQEEAIGIINDYAEKYVSGQNWVKFILEGGPQVQSASPLVKVGAVFLQDEANGAKYLTRAMEVYQAHEGQSSSYLPHPNLSPKVAGQTWKVDTLFCYDDYQLAYRQAYQTVVNAAGGDAAWASLTLAEKEAVLSRAHQKGNEAAKEWLMRWLEGNKMGK